MMSANPTGEATPPRPACCSSASGAEGSNGTAEPRELTNLRRKHQTLADRIDQLAKSPGCDSFELQQLKKQKLQLKDEIARLERENNIRTP